MLTLNEYKMGVAILISYSKLQIKENFQGRWGAWHNNKGVNNPIRHTNP